MRIEILSDATEDLLDGYHFYEWPGPRSRSRDFESQRRILKNLKGLFDQAIAAVADDAIIVPRISPAIRALGIAAKTAI